MPHESGGYLVRANGAGFRCNHEFSRMRQPGTRRVLLFGDSFTAGDGVSNEKRYGNVLETILPNLEVYNFGLPGTGTDQHYLAYQEFASGIEHDLLIIAVLVENIRRVAARYRPYTDEHGREVAFAKPYYERIEGELRLCGVPPPREPVALNRLPEDQHGFVDRSGRFRAMRRLVNAAGLRDMAQRLTRYQPLPDYERADDPLWLLMAAILSEWIERHPTPVVVVPLPLYQHVEETSDPRGYQARFRELSEVTGCRVHDPLPDLLRYSPAERRAFRFERDIHPTAAGHAALAASFAPVVESLLPSHGVGERANGHGDPATRAPGLAVD